MKNVSFYDKYNGRIALALGFFDCIHVGHAALIGRTVAWAKERGTQSALLTFTNDINVAFGAPKQIYTFDDRLQVLAKQGVDMVIGCPFDDKFAAMSPDMFLRSLADNFDIAAVFVGADYTFGNGAAGDVKFLAEWCDKQGIELNIVPFECENGKKISTSALKALVTAGDVEALNGYLSQTYFMRGKVVHAREVGRGLGFPTANIPIDSDRLPLRDGIYATQVELDGRSFAAMTNVGAKPTFGDSNASIETYIFDFDGEIYGKEITLSFFKRTRDVTRFESAEQLKNQLAQDEAQIKEYFSRKGKK